MILGSSSGQLEGDPGRFATPFDTKKEPEQEPELDKETCVEKYLAMWQCSDFSSNITRVAHTQKWNFFSIINLFKRA